MLRGGIGLLLLRASGEWEGDLPSEISIARWSLAQLFIPKVLGRKERRGPQGCWGFGDASGEFSPPLPSSLSYYLLLSILRNPLTWTIVNSLRERKSVERKRGTDRRDGGEREREPTPVKLLFVRRNLQTTRAIFLSQTVTKKRRKIGVLVCEVGEGWSTSRIFTD